MRARAHKPALLNSATHTHTVAPHHTTPHHTTLAPHHTTPHNKQHTQAPVTTQARTAGMSSASACTVTPGGARSNGA